MELQYRACDVEIRALREDSRSVEVVCSTDALDSYGEVVEQVWDLGRYRSNPVVLWAHNGRELPLGRAEDVRIEGGKLVASLVFASEKANPKAEQVLQLFRERCLKSVSVGFNPRTVRYEKRDDEEVPVLSDNELFEISVTPVPANPEALSRMRQRAMAARAEKKAMEELEALRAQLAARDGDIETASKALGEAADRISVLETERDKALTGLEESRSVLAMRESEIARLQSALVEREVDALVGKKITAAEREEFVELAKSNRTLFERMVGKRADMKLMEKVIQVEPAPLASTAGNEPNGNGLAAEAMRRARS